jgi:hypothetical protein
MQQNRTLYQHMPYTLRDKTLGFHVRGDQTSWSEFTQKQGRNISETWILLDNQLTVNVFRNASLLENTCNSKIILNIHCKAE